MSLDNVSRETMVGLETRIPVAKEMIDTIAAMVKDYQEQ